MEDPLYTTTLVLFLCLYAGAIALYSVEILNRISSKNKTSFVAMAIMYWLTVHPLFLYVATTRFGSYTDSSPVVITALNLPSLLSIMALATYEPFRKFVDQLSLVFLIETAEAVPRILVGSTFLVWWYHGQLPGYFAWVAGPGDILAGVFAFGATRFALAPELKTGTGSANEIISKIVPTLDTLEKVENILRRLHWAMGLVLFGILDFVAAPGSSIFSIAMGEVPEAMGQVPLAMVPTMLVPTAFTLEVWAWCQMWQLRASLMTRADTLTKKNQ